MRINPVSTLARKLNIRSYHRWVGEGDDSGGANGANAGSGEGAGEGAGTGTSGGNTGDGKQPKTFTQSELDAIVQKRLGKYKDENNKLLSQLKQLEQTANLTQEERESLRSRIEELETTYLSEQEKAVKKVKETEERFQNDLKKVGTERDAWKRRFEDSTIERALTDAAVSAEAENPAQIRLMFRGTSYLQEAVDEATGKPTGNFVARLKFHGLDEDTKQLKEFDLPIEEALKKIKTDGLNKNLFKHRGTPGTGTTPVGGSKEGDSSEMPKPEDFGGDHSRWYQAYKEWRSKHDLSEIK